MMYRWWDGSTAPWYDMIFGPIAMIVLIALSAIMIVWLLRAIGLAGEPRARESSPLDILKERFARGEIDRTQYEERKALLSKP